MGARAPVLRLRNDLYCVEWGVKLYSLTHAPVPYGVGDTVSDILMVNPAGVIDV